MIVAIVILSILLAFSIFKNVKFGITILRMEDTLEECLDVIDEKYEIMSEILSRPLFYDSPEVRHVVQDIKAVKDSLHVIAFSLTRNIEGEKKDGDDKKEEN